MAATRAETLEPESFYKAAKVIKVDIGYRAASDPGEQRPWLRLARVESQCRALLEKAR